MAAKTTNVPKQLVPYEAGTVVVTPIDTNTFRPIYDQSVMTQHNFLASTQVTESTTTEEIENGNGSNATVVNSKQWSLTVTSNVMNIVFDNFVRGNIEKLPDKVLAFSEFTYQLPTTVPEDGLSITFGANKDREPVPAAEDSGEYWFIVEDSFGNPLVRLDTPQHGAYSWDADTKTISFSADYAGAAIRVMYRYATTDSIQYESNPVLSQRLFQIDTYGTTVDLTTNEKVYKHERLVRASLSGDVSGLTGQKSRSTSITYTFNSQAVPAGVSAYSSDWHKITDSNAGSGNASRVNGGDENFTTTPVGT